MSRGQYPQLRLLDHQHQDKGITKLYDNLEKLQGFILELDEYDLDSEEMTKLHQKFQSMKAIQFKLEAQKEAISGAKLSIQNNNANALAGLSQHYNELYSRALSNMPNFQGFRAPEPMQVDEAEAAVNEEQIQHALDESGIAIAQEHVSLICPITQQLMKTPVFNKLCGHYYDWDGVQSHVRNCRQLVVKCPVGGCQSTVNLSNLAHNKQLQARLQQQQQQQRQS